MLQMYNIYSKIINPKTNRKVSINSTLGKKILYNYINQLGGTKYSIYLKHKGCYINDTLKLQEKPYEWLYYNLTIISHNDKALDTYTNSLSNNKGYITTWTINDGLNQQFILFDDNTIKTKRGNRNLIFRDDKLQYSNKSINTVTYEKVPSPLVPAPLVPAPSPTPLVPSPSSTPLVPSPNPLVPTPLVPAPTPNPVQTINYISYNILTAHPYFENDFKTESKYKTWGLGREKLIKSAIHGKDLGVLVECVEDTLPYLLDSNISYEFFKKNGGGEIDGSAIIYNNELFDVTDVYKSPIFIPHSQVVLRVNFKSKLSGKKFIVVALHLKSGERQDMEDRRLKEMEKALKLSLKGIDKTIPVIISGDFNTCAMTAKNWHYPFTQTALNPLLKKGFKMIPLKLGQITYKYWQESVFDYVFIRGNISFTGNLESGESKGTEKAPNQKQGSDHFPVTVKLNL